MFSSCKREEPGHSQSKPKFSNVKSSAVVLWEPLPILWAPAGLDSDTSLALSSMAHPAHLNELGQLHSRAAAVVRGHPTALASPNCWSLHGLSSRNSSLATSWQASTLVFLHGLFSPGVTTAAEAVSSPMAFPRLSHDFKPQMLSVIPPCLQNLYYVGDSYTSPSAAFTPSGPQLLCENSKEHFPEDLTSAVVDFS